MSSETQEARKAIYPKEALALHEVAHPGKHRYALQNVCLLPNGGAWASDGRMMVILTPPSEVDGQAELERAAGKRGPVPLGDDCILLPAKMAHGLLRDAQGPFAVTEFSRVEESGQHDVEASVKGKRGLVRRAETVPDGHFPPCLDALPEGEPKAVVRIKGRLLAKLLHTAVVVASRFGADLRGKYPEDEVNIDIEVREPNQAVVLRFTRPDGLKFTGAVMPLSTE